MKIEIKRQLEEKLRKKMMLLPEFLSDYIFSLEYRRKEIRTRIEYTKDILLFLEFLIKENISKAKSTNEIKVEDLKNLNKRDIWNFLSYLTSYEKEYLSVKGTLIKQEFSNTEHGKARKLASLTELFKYLQENEIIDKNVIENISIKIDAKASLKNRLSPEDMQLFYNTILNDLNIGNTREENYHKKLKYRDYIIVLLLSYTGIRVSELVQLDISDISVSDEVMIIIRKGGHQERVSIPSVILEDIRNYIDYRKQLELPTKALFVSMHKKRIHPRSINLLLDKYRQRANINIKISPHVFRRTFGTLHYNRYRDMYLTAQILGHRSAETTRKFYADPSEERKIQSMKEFTYDIFEKNNQENDSISLTNEQILKIEKETGINLKKFSI